MSQKPWSRRCWGLGLTALLLSGASSSLYAQQVGPFILQGQSGHSVLKNPRGFGAFASVPLLGPLYFRLSYERIARSYREEGLVCGRYAPNISCRMEEVNTESSLASLRISFVPTLGFRDLLKLGVGGGVSFNQVSADSRGVSGRKANLEAPKTGQLGYLALLTVAVKPIRSLPLSLVGSVSSHWVDFEHCVSYEEVYDPFCGTTLFRELSLGVAAGF